MSALNLSWLPEDATERELMSEECWPPETKESAWPPPEPLDWDAVSAELDDAPEVNGDLD